MYDTEGEITVYPQKQLLHTRHAKFRRMLLALAMWACSAILISCKPTALPSTFNSSIILPPTLTEVAVRQVLATKVADLANIDQTKTAARLTPHPKILKPTPTPQTSLPEPTAFPPVSALHGENVTPVGIGVIGQFMPLLNKGRYHIFNAWVENQRNDRQRVFVWAGELAGSGGEETTQGVVIVEIVQILVKDGMAVDAFVEAKEYLTPGQAGPVTIVDAAGERLVVRSVMNGTTFYFDVPSRQFVPSMTAIVPTATIPISPLATPTPAP